MKRLIETICILDRSSSMTNIMRYAVDALNRFWAEQRDKLENSNVTLVSFDDVIERPYKRIHVSKLPDLQYDHVEPRGLTALYDAVGQTVKQAKLGLPTICIILSDGEDNASTKFKPIDIRRLVEEKEEEGWFFLFVAVGDEAMEVGRKMGFESGNILTVPATKGGMQFFGEAMSAATETYIESL